MNLKANLTHIETIDDLKTEQIALKARLRLQEAELKEHFKSVPKEALKAGVNAVMPPLLQNKANSTIFSAGKNIVGSLFAQKGTKGSILWKGLRQAGMYFIMKQAVKLFLKNK